MNAIRSNIFDIDDNILFVQEIKIKKDLFAQELGGEGYITKSILKLSKYNITSAKIASLLQQRPERLSESLSTPQVPAVRSIEEDPSIELVPDEPFSNLFTNVCKELESLDPALVDTCTLKETSYTFETLGDETLGDEIQRLNMRDPICALIRSDAALTHQLLRKDTHFRQLAYRTALFNTSRDAALRLQAKVIPPALVSIFQEFKELYKDYVTGRLTKHGEVSVLELLHLYMRLVTFNTPSTSASCRSIKECFETMQWPEDPLGACRKVLEYSTADPERFPQFFFIPTYALISKKTMLKAWGAGIFFLGCTSKKNESIHGVPSTPLFSFVHDCIHFSGYIHKREADSARLFPRMQNNARKIFKELDRLATSEESTERELSSALEDVLFQFHHESANVFLKKAVQSEKFLIGRDEKLKAAKNYYCAFASKSFD